MTLQPPSAIITQKICKKALLKWEQLPNEFKIWKKYIIVLQRH